jgi:uncharacterized protein YoxC
VDWSAGGVTRYTPGMPWYVLLIIALASIVFVLAVLARTGLKAFRVLKHASAVSTRVAPLVDGLTRRSDEITAAADRLSADGQELTANVQRLQRSISRLQVVAATFNDALRPYYIIAGWLSGDREWEDLHFF